MLVCFTILYCYICYLSIFVDYISLNGRMIVIDEQERMWREVVTSYSKLLK